MPNTYNNSTNSGVIPSDPPSNDFSLPTEMTHAATAEEARRIINELSPELSDEEIETIQEALRECVWLTEEQRKGIKVSKNGVDIEGIGFVSRKITPREQGEINLSTKDTVLDGQFSTFIGNEGTIDQLKNILKCDSKELSQIVKATLGIKESPSWYLTEQKGVSPQYLPKEIIPQDPYINSEQKGVSPQYLPKEIIPQDPYINSKK